ncbi:Ribosome biogenesis (Nop4) [Rasamsonia emersonii CBS 393.64]|uniref:Ribosome biogenesis (Nop4) n=1 Tax=Rasamsonia emersonii (strain ATCC 16479 / CBS 393.64 / IMI 116815) TaxID=1408163 RepID=A0A0F4Z557_RASE3|nr:Ribosome biogenesis (Nop4) [Rasamsonia emersonii CBS 393.64]KKA25632.1 Ribosome biogenesis (Nop4) [Rasamsonia emersonii CBS 393.64]
MAETRKRRRLSEDGSFQTEEASHTEQTENDPPAETSQTASKQLRRELFVRGLPLSVTTERLTEFFSQSYVIKHATVVLDPQTKQSRGYGFVTFADLEDAQRALDEFNGADLDGKKIKVEVAQPRHREIDEKEGKSVPTAEAIKLKEEREIRKQLNQPPKLIIRNLPWSIKEPDQLAALFRSFGKVKRAVVPKKGKRQAGFGFVVLRGRKNAERAIEAVNGKVVDGRTLAVDWAVEKHIWEKLTKETEDKEGEKDTADGAAEGSDQDENEADEDVSMKDGEESDENMEDTEDEEEDKEEDEEDEEEEEEEEEEEDDDDDDDDDDEKDEEAEDERNASTVFIRNLPFTCSDETLYKHFTQFGPVRYARIVVDPETNRPRGTGFVCFRNVDDAALCVKNAPKQPDATRKDADKSKKASTASKPSILQNETIDPTGRYTMEDRVLLVTHAVSKSEAAKLAEESSSRRSAKKEDKRRLFLLNEGTIPPNSELYKLLSPSEIKMRADSLKQRQTLIKNNPSLHMSLTRLSVRNIPRQISSKDLKALARQAVVGFARDVKEGLRQPLSPEEMRRGIEETREADKQRRRKGKGIVKQAKIVFEDRSGSKISEKSGVGRSRGYGFIEYYTHRHALMGLRWLNGHLVEARSKDGTTEKKKRLIVEFAIENAQVVKRRKEFQERMRNLSKAQMQNKKSDNEEAKDKEETASSGQQAKRGTKRKRAASSDGGKANKKKDNKDKGELSQEEKNKLAKRNRIIAKKRMQRKMRKKGKA